MSGTSRYLGVGQIMDNGLLREGRTTVYLDVPPPVEYVDREDNFRFTTRGPTRLDTLAVAYYGDPTLWWVIAAFQPEPLFNTALIPSGTDLVIPSSSYVFENILRRV